MNIKKTLIEDCYILEPDVFNDNRGFFYELYNEKKYKAFGIKHKFVQDNFSNSKKHVLRGLHFQKKDSQGKLVSVINGEVFDVVVDIRKDSKTYGRYISVNLSSKNKYQLWIPKGLAHGLLALTDNVDFLYKCTDFYNPAHEETLIWNDPEININWPISNPTMSSKDLEGKLLKEINDD